ncbi:MAG: magnesium transporter [Kiritimatiellia bacterium]
MSHVATEHLDRPQVNALDLHAMILKQRVEEMRAFCTDTHPAGVAEVLQRLAPAQIWGVLQTVEADLRADIYSHLDESAQVDLMLQLDRKSAAKLLTDMPPDDRADLFKRLPEDQRTGILPAMAQAEREDIRRLASYKEGTVGSMMTSDYAMLEAGITVTEAIDKLRMAAPDRETIYYAYVVDANRHLIGFVSLRELILALPHRRVDDIMHTDAAFAKVDEDQETAARRLQKYDLIALPIVDASDVLVGILTHDDAFDILVQEQQEDLEKLVAIGGTHEAGVYMKTTPWRHFRNRVWWVVGLAAVGLLSGQIVHHYEDLIEKYIILAMFLPLLADAGGNTGSQSATLVIRALALGEVRMRDIWRVISKEAMVAAMLGLVLGSVAFLRIVLLPGALPDGMGAVRIAYAVALALTLQVISATLLGALLPLAASRFKLDPAVVASPALTTAVDVTGLLIYFGCASLILGM